MQRLDSIVEQIASQLELSLLNGELGKNAVLDHWESLHPPVSTELAGVVARAAEACLTDTLARLRTRSPLPESLPPDLSQLARLCAKSGPRAATPANLCLFPPHELWEQFPLATELAADAGVLRWEAAKVASARLTRYVKRLGELFAREYEQELAGMSQPASATHRSLVERVLDGEWIDPAELGYDLAGEHLAFVSSARAPNPFDGLRQPGRAILQVPAMQGITWTWIGADHAPTAAEIDFIGAAHREQGALVAIGEPGDELQGFRASHDQALEAWAIAEAVNDNVIRYRDVALIVALLRDQSLAQVFLARELGALVGTTKRETELRQVVRTYLDSAQNTVATASKLGCGRRTVERKLQQAELLVGHLIRQRSAELSLALRLANLAAPEFEQPARVGGNLRRTTDYAVPDSASRRRAR